MEKNELKSLADYALDEMPDSMGEKEREQYRHAMHKKIDAGEVGSPVEILAEFDKMDQEKAFYDSNQP